MSLGSILSASSRPRIPEAALSEVAEVSKSDALVVENIVTVASELIPFLNVLETSIQHLQNTYFVRIALSGNKIPSFLQMKQLCAQYPARIENIHIEQDHVKKLSIIISITNEKTPYTCTQIEVVRVLKRQRVD